MKDNNMIEVKKVSMRFNLGIEKNFSLKQFFVDFFDPRKHKKKAKKPEFWALTDLDFTVKSGEVVGYLQGVAVEIDHGVSGDKMHIAIEATARVPT